MAVRDLYQHVIYQYRHYRYWGDMVKELDSEAGVLLSPALTRGPEGARLVILMHFRGTIAAVWPVFTAFRKPKARKFDYYYFTTNKRHTTFDGKSVDHEPDTIFFHRSMIGDLPQLSCKTSALMVSAQ